MDIDNKSQVENDMNKIPMSDTPTDVISLFSSHSEVFSEGECRATHTNTCHSPSAGGSDVSPLLSQSSTQEETQSSTQKWSQELIEDGVIIDSLLLLARSGERARNDSKAVGATPVREDNRPKKLPRVDEGLFRRDYKYDSGHYVMKQMLPPDVRSKNYSGSEFRTRNKVMSSKLPSESLPPSEGRCEASEVIKKAYIGSTLRIELPDIWSVRSPSNISLNTIHGNYKVDAEYIDVEFLPNDVAGIRLHIANSRNNESLIGEEFAVSIINSKHIDPVIRRLVDRKIVIENLDCNEETQYVKAPAPRNYKEFIFSIRDTDNSIVENIEDDANIEIMLLLANSDEPVIKDGKAVKVTLVGEDNYPKRIDKRKIEGFFLREFASGNGRYVVKQKLSPNVLSKNYSGSEFKTRIKVTAGSKVLTAYSGSYMVKSRAEPSGVGDKKKRLICQFMKEFRDCLTKLEVLDGTDVANYEMIFANIRHGLLKLKAPSSWTSLTLSKPFLKNNISDNKLMTSKLPSESLPPSEGRCEASEVIKKAYIGSTLRIELPNIWSVRSPSNISLNTIHGNYKVDAEYIDVEFLPNDVAGIRLHIANSRNNESLIGEEFAVSIINSKHIDPVIRRLVDRKIAIENLDCNEETQYVKAPAPRNYKEFIFSIRDTDNSIVENIEDDANIEIMLLLANSDEPVIKDGKAVKVTLVGEDNYPKRSPRVDEGVLLRYFKSSSGRYVVKQKLPPDVLSKNYSGSEFKTRIKVTAGSKVLTAYSGSYMVKSRAEPSGVGDKKKRLICQFTKEYKHLIENLDICSSASVEDYAEILADFHKNVLLEISTSAYNLNNQLH